jgi:DNA-binding transcriptional MerR regulator
MMTTTKAESDLIGSFLKNDQREFFRIRDASLAVGVKAYVLRFWESEFSALRPEKSPTGQRVYRRKDILLLFWIKKLLYQDRYSIEGANQKLKELRLDGALKVPPDDERGDLRREPPLARTVGLSIQNFDEDFQNNFDVQELDSSVRAEAELKTSVSEYLSTESSRGALEQLEKLAVKNLAALF